MKHSNTIKNWKEYGRTRILVTGASGFIGTNLLEALSQRKVLLCAMSHAHSTAPFGGLVDRWVKADMAIDKDYGQYLEDVDVVVHLAARVHVMNDLSMSPLEEYRKVNVNGTLKLARQAVDAGVSRFIFLSSIKVIGEETNHGIPFTEVDPPRPSDPYALSKLEAEKGLLGLSQKTGMEVVIIRPPLVYGPGVKANFLRMMRWLYKGLPLPFGAINNKRSLVALDNLIDLITICLDHPKAANQVFLVSDGEDLSTTDLLRRLAKALNRPARLLPIPHCLLEIFLKMAARRDLAQRLLGSLQVDISKAKKVLGWQPPVSVDEGLKKTAEWFLALEDKD